MIRPATPRDFAAMGAIEVAAGELFREFGMSRIADDPPPTPADLDGHAAAWVAVEDDGEFAGYLVADRIDDACHIEQVSVHPAHSRRGIGASLVDTAAGWARANGLGALTLTTFADVPWNAPYYSRLGFVALPESALTPALRAKVLAEAGHGLDPLARVVMRRAV